MFPFNPQPLTPAQQEQVNQRIQASAKLGEINQDIQDAKTQLAHLYDLWVGFSNLPNQSPLDTNVPNKEKTAADYWATHTLINKLVDYYGNVLGWKLNIGQPNHPPEMPVYVP
jgi:hypothetical protein